MIFADTNALFASLVENDRLSRVAQRAEERLRTAREELWTIDAILLELWGLLLKGFGSQRADVLVAGILQRGVRRERVEEIDYLRAWEIGREWPNVGLSLADRQAFAVMERTRRYRAWSYDNDFATVRLGPGRARAIELFR